MRSKEHGTQPDLDNKYSKFVPYLEALQAVCDLVQVFHEQCSTDDDGTAYEELMLYSEETLYDLRCAVVRGDVKALHSHHDEYIRRLVLMLQTPAMDESGPTNFDTGSSLCLLSEAQAVSLGCALTVLTWAFPQNIDTFDLGAMHVERAITRWQARNESRDEETELGADESSREVSYDNFNNLADEVLYFTELRCAGSDNQECRMADAEIADRRFEVE